MSKSLANSVLNLILTDQVLVSVTMETANLGGHFGEGKKSGELKGTDMIKLCFLIGLVTQKPMRANVNPSPYLPSTPCTVPPGYNLGLGIS